ncbi:hypothetical protein HG15A2_01810 [Adhaeretor mobilis]|uniref:Uncharacterized protein n=2 Tax=Adhaeretor mobilis TaxID=1930276 RepID=A0A517MPY1_9BACT|nr:hypothetical protein HG15A2_01810 [Adhaeretor mobilis]
MFKVATPRLKAVPFLGLCSLVLALTFSLSHVKAIDSITAGSLTAPFPTFENLSFEWEFSGDDNNNASVDIQYRPVGSTTWSQGMPLRRVEGGTNNNAGGQSWTTKYSGSLFGLDPGTNYEVQLDLTDPNGGSQQQSINVGTRALPDFTQGTLVELAPGFHGELVVESGTPGNPMIYRSQQFDNPAQFSSIDLQGKSNVIIMGLEVNSPNGHGIKANGASDFVIARNTINARHGIRALSDATNGYIVDNIVQGQTVWAENSLGASGNNVGEGIEISGPGNVIAYNTVRGFRDNISTLEFEGGTADQRSIDIHNNEILVAGDDGVEADFTQGNVRVYENRITDAFIGISTQPTLGGPTYIMRNVMYNVTSVPFKPNRFSTGDVIMHNTVVKVGSGLFTNSGNEYSNALFRNNLAIGGVDVGDINGYSAGNSRPADLRNCDGSCDYDYDAVGITTAASPINSARIYNPNSTPFLTVEQNGMILTGISAADMGPLFPGVSQPTTKTQVLTEHMPQDLRLGNSAPVIDQAEVIPGVNDDFLGSGPDMGAYEAGQELPTYGQRALVVGDFNYDFDVDSGDLSVFQTSYGVNSLGDTNGNGSTDGLDFLVFQRALSASGATATQSVSVVPEPSGLLLMIVAGIMGLGRRRSLAPACQLKY